MKNLARPAALLMTTLVMFTASHFSLNAWAESGSSVMLSTGITTSIIAGLGFFSFAISIAGFRQGSGPAAVSSEIDFPMIPRRAPVPRNRNPLPTSADDTPQVSTAE